MSKRLATGLAVLASAAALTALAAGPALADPPTGVTPLLTDIVGGGGHTLLSDQFSADYNATSPASKLYNWDEVNPLDHAEGDPVTAKGDGFSDPTCSITRPPGPDYGIAELGQGTQDQGDYCIDFVASSRLPLSTDPDTIAFAVMGGDAITWATPDGTSSDPSPAPATLTLTDLLDIYNCTYTNWDQAGGTNAPIAAVLPQNGSSTRDTFLLALGELTGGTNPLTPGSCVINGTDANGDPIEDSTGVTAGNITEFGTTTSPDVGAIYPYSIGDYIAQSPAAGGVGGHATSIWAHGDLGLRNVSDDGGIVQPPTTTNASNQVVINQNFPAELQTVLFNVVRNGGTPSSPAYPATPSYEATALPAIFGPSGWICTNPTAQNDLTSYGFYQEPNCGQLTDHFLNYG